MKRKPRLYGLLARFDRREGLIDAVVALKVRGYERIETFSPFPVEETGDLIHGPRRLIPLFVLMGGLSGAAAGYLLQYYTAVIDFPLNVGGRPLHSWPAFIPVTFELSVTFAAIAGITAFLIATHLPRLHHPLFNDPEFDRASWDRLFLCAEASDRKFDVKKTRELLEHYSEHEVREVMW